MSVSPEVIIGSLLTVGAGLSYVAPKVMSVIRPQADANRIPHDEVQTLIEFFVSKGDKDGTDMARGCGQALYRCIGKDKETPVGPVSSGAPLTNQWPAK